MKNIFELMKELVADAKKLILIALLAALSVVSVDAQVHRSESFLNVRSLSLGTNLYNITNLAAYPHYPGLILNPTNVTYTNATGTFVGSGTTELASFGTTNTFTRPAIFRDVPLYVDRDGNRPLNAIWDSGPTGVTGGMTNATFLSPLTLFLEYALPQGTNGPFGVTFTPVWNGKNVSLNTNDWWGVRVAGGAPFGILAGSRYSIATNVPLWRWPGASHLRVLSVTNMHNQALAGPPAQTNSPFITDLSINGYVP